MKGNPKGERETESTFGEQHTTTRTVLDSNRSYVQSAQARDKVFFSFILISFLVRYTFAQQQNRERRGGKEEKMKKKEKEKKKKTGNVYPAEVNDEKENSRAFWSCGFREAP